MKRESRLILALDVTERERALAVAGDVADVVDAVKVNYPIVLGCGLGIVRELATMTDVICDFKVADVPNTNRLIVELVRETGAKGVICQGFVGRDSLEACIKAAEGMDVFVVAEMSHPGAGEFIKPRAEDMAKLAVEVGASGIIAPATRPERVKVLRGIVGNLLILTPGVGAQGGSAGAAVKAGADYVIVGRSIYQSESPREAAEALVGEIKVQ
jgi:orotidine-5'-phosphate decarboxylase